MTSYLCDWGNGAHAERQSSALTGSLRPRNHDRPHLDFYASLTLFFLGLLPRTAAASFALYLAAPQTSHHSAACFWDCRHDNDSHCYPAICRKGRSEASVNRGPSLWSPAYVIRMVCQSKFHMQLIPSPWDALVQ